ncbi:MAG: uracil-DNA glycosylase [Deltaproteobacteria bacterium]|nr:MAG: uracil-DNA glycosylase [Deltaproteobacteria bacterium]
MGTPASQGRLAQIARALATYVEYQRELGVLGFPRSTPAAAPNPRPVRVDASPRDLFTEAGVAQARTLAELREAIGDCRRCKLAPHRTHVVFGVGNPRARLVFVGEAPGRDEDVQGEPFVGRAGQLLTEIITKGMRLRREDVYIANVIKCRPPENRNPEPDEVATCEPFLVRQLELIAPEVIVALGKFAAQTLLRTKTPITQLRGRWFDYHGIRLMPTFHPAYLLRNPGDKRLVWEDIRKVMGALGIGGASA